jgi:Domain of unknown function (DUF4424)
MRPAQAHHFTLYCLASLALVSAASALFSASAAADGSNELPAGGLAFAANPSIAIEQQDIQLSRDLITLTYALRNDAQSQQTIVIAFTLPELDTNAVSDGEVILPSADPANFVQFSPQVDGQAPSFRVEQRALALGLDVSDVLARHHIPLFPFAGASQGKLAELNASDRLDLLERGILKEDGSAVVAAWTLRTVAYWRQSLQAGQKINIAISYRPIAGVASYKAETLQSQRKRACLTAAQEAAIAKLPTEGGVAPTLTSVGLLASNGGDQLGPARRMRILIEAGDQSTIVATCRDGLKRTGPTQLEWTATDHLLDEDLHVLFVR